MTPSDLDAIEQAAHVGAAVVDGEGRRVASGREFERLLAVAAQGGEVEASPAVPLGDGTRLVIAREARADMLERQLDAVREADRRKDEFLALLGHELRNPLAPILTALEVMRLHGDEMERERRVIERQVRHMVQLVDDLLDISRITRGKIQLKRTAVEVSGVMAKAIEMASPLLEQREHRLSVEVAREGLVVEGDPVRLSQVFANLLTNAAKYTEPRGHIDVRAMLDEQADEVVVRISDDGIGIPAHLLPRIFEPFFQGERVVDRAHGGLGLGLPLVHSLVRLHGGEVNGESDGTGQGSAFTVRLPRAGPATTQKITQPMLPFPPPAQKRRVMVVDDNEDAADLLVELLRNRGHDTVVAYDGPQALALAERIAFDAAIVDIGLPVMDGYELARRLSTRSGILMIALTGYGQETDRKRSEEAGFAVHLVKPADIREILEALEVDQGGGVAQVPSPS
jgi:signal transduction histidine kinase/ActR/RegA family two-component response regulator